MARRRSRWIWAIASIAILVAPPVGLTVAANRNLAHELALARKAGIPVTRQDLASDPAMDAAPAYKNIAALRTRFSRGDSFIYNNLHMLLLGPEAKNNCMFYLGHPITDSEIKSVFARLEKLSAADWKTVESRASISNDVGSRVWATCSSGILAGAKIGDVAMCRRWADRFRRLCRQLRSDDLDFTFVRGISYESVLHTSVQRAVAMKKDDPAFVRFGRDFYAHPEPMPDFRITLQTAIPDAIESLQELRAKPSSSQEFDEEMEPKERTWKERSFWRNFSLNFPWTAASAKAAAVRSVREYHQGLPEDAEDIRAALAAANSAKQRIENDTTVAGEICREVTMLEENFDSMFMVGLATRRRLSAAFVAVMEARLREGRYPDTIPAEAARITDPFTDRPFIYQRTPTGFTLTAPEIPSRPKPMEVFIDGSRVDPKPTAQPAGSPP